MSNHGSLAQMLRAGEIGVQFSRSGDRWGHAIGFLNGDQFHALLESIEASSEDAWPCSPPCQELHIEMREGGTVALLVGQASKCHWSLSIAASACDSALHFDVACRVPSADRLGALLSAYRYPNATSTDSEKSASPDLESSRTFWIGEKRIVLKAGNGSSLWQEIEGELVVEAGPAEFNFPATFRWQYAVLGGEK